MQVAGDVANGEELLTVTRETCPDLLLLDWGLPGLTDELLDRLREECPGVYIIVLSGRPETASLAIDSGADAFVCKCDSAQRLLEAIEGYQKTAELREEMS
jgi:DNA-binding response OmpR family regulator